MSKCIRCGKDIDLIFKNDDTVFYCKIGRASCRERV